MRLCQILRSPDSESEGSLVANEFVTISRAELDELRARAAEIMAPRIDPNDSPVTRLELAEAIQARVVTAERDVIASEQKSADLERAYKAALLDRELATALVGKPLVPGAASQLIKLWRDDFEVVDEDGEIQVRSRDGRSVGQTIESRLAGPEFAHFCLPPSRGGTSSRGQNRSSEPEPKPASPKNLGEAILIRWRETASRPQASLIPSGWGRRR
jgi:hypothetical protein